MVGHSGDVGRPPAGTIGDSGDSGRPPDRATEDSGDVGRRPDRATKDSGDGGRRPARATEHSGDVGRPPAGVSDPVLRLEAWRRRGRSLRLKLIVEAPAPTGRAFSPTSTNTKDYAQRALLH